MLTNDTLILDVHTSDEYKYVFAKQHDTNSRKIDISLTDNNTPLTIDVGVIARIRGTKGNGEWFIYDCTINNNLITVVLKEYMLNVAGRVLCDIGLYESGNTDNPKDDKLLSSANFYLYIEESAYNDKAVIKSDDAQTLAKLIGEQRILNKETKALNKRSQELITQMEQMLGIT